MAPIPSRKLSIILERIPMESRWADHRWDLAAVVPDEGGEARTVADEGAIVRRLYPGFEVELRRDEAEGYYLNFSSEIPSVFVSLRIDDAGEPYPFQATLSYNEAARWMDSNERVERAAAWPELAGWGTDWVAENYRPEPKKRQRPKSFKGKEGRLREEGSS